MFHRSGRLNPWHTAVSLNGSRQGASFAADKRPCPLADPQFEIKAGTKDILPQQSSVIRLVNGPLQPFHSQRIFSPDIDIAVMGAGGNGRDKHSLNDPVRLSFHHGPVHKGSRIPLVAIAHNIFCLFLLIQYLLPLSSGGKSAAAAASQTGFCDLIHNVHIKESLRHGRIAPQRKIFRNALCIDMPAVFQCDTRLLSIERNLLLFHIGIPLFVFIDQVLDHLIPDNGFLNDLFTVIDTNLYVQPSHRLDPQQRPHLTETMASAFLQPYAVPMRLLLQNQGTL